MPHIEDEASDGEYRTSNQYHSQPSKPLRVICVGAGAAGLLVAYKMKKSFSNYELVCYEKNPSVGGTWYENRYPGCACDVPAHAYTFSFEPNPNWSTFYAYAPEIRQYFEDFADKYELRPYIKLDSTVQSATWDDTKGIWNVEVDVNGQKVKDWAHVVINGTGFLNDWKWPKIDGLHDFAGKLLHTANWETDMDWTDKTVAIIGTGSSAIQAVPRLQKTAKHLIAMMRSATWISPPLGSGADSSNDEDKDQVADHQYTYSEAAKKKFRDDPQHLLKYRKELETSINELGEVFIAGSDASKGAKEGMQAEMERRIGPGHEELKKKLIPKWSPGCRRITPGDGYLEALVQPNVTTVHEDVTKIVPEGLVDAKGVLHKCDVLVCATGFNLAFAPRWEITGTNGLTMREAFNPEPQVYLAMASPGFPNYWTINGVRGCWANGVALPPHEACVDYIMKCCKKLQDEQMHSLEVKQEPVTQLYEHIDAWHQGSVFNENCESWYKNNIPGGKLWIWGGSSLHYMKTIQDVKWEHYDHRYRSNNMWAYLGNGKVWAEANATELEHDEKIDKLAPYMRAADTPWQID